MAAIVSRPQCVKGFSFITVSCIFKSASTTTKVQIWYSPVICRSLNTWSKMNDQSELKTVFFNGNDFISTAMHLVCIFHYTIRGYSIMYNFRGNTHYNDVTMGSMMSQITSLTIVYSAVYSGADQRKHQSSASLAFMWRIHLGPVNSPHKWPVTRKIFPFDDVIMQIYHIRHQSYNLCSNTEYIPNTSYGWRCSWSSADNNCVAL